MKYHFRESKTIYRGANDLNIDDLEEGMELEYRSYLSTTCSEEKAEDFIQNEKNPILYINIEPTIQFSIPDIYSMCKFTPRGIAYPGRGSMGELEFLLPRNHKLVITKIIDDKVFVNFI